jgi:hypothetical protein
MELSHSFWYKNPSTSGKGGETIATIKSRETEAVTV